MQGAGIVVTPTLTPSLHIIAFIIFMALAFDFTMRFTMGNLDLNRYLHESALAAKGGGVCRVLQLHRSIFLRCRCGEAPYIRKQIINLTYVDTVIVPYIILAALLGAIGWKLITWYSGLPTSSSHALIGGLAGAGIAAAGLVAIKLGTLDTIIIFMVFSPIIGFILAFFSHGMCALDRERSPAYGHA